MPRGGARTKSGPPPDPRSLRQGERHAEDWETLPAEGRKGRTPKWPLTRNPLGELEQREKLLWRDLWKKPQAIVWEREGLEYQIGMYVRRAVEAELPMASAGLGTLVLRMADNLGITAQGMRANRWKIGAVQVETDDDEDDENVIDARDLFVAGG